ncbi:uncharacterized protein LOC6571641 [Drosophila grimshawi]|uniref:uncharacterized protein LOC6571641 n=1 Tax=Drosophila grimshawi TaxID=7222 RepID=UPI001C933545|nr:uncharacterized protein LOC6571641 [Drosophila grimshawi]
MNNDESEFAIRRICLKKTIGEERETRILPLQYCDPKIVYKTTNIECLPDPSYAENATCFVKAVNWNKAVAQMDCDLILPLSNISVRVELLKKSYTNRYHPFLINVTVNMCDVIAKRNFIPYGTIFWKILKNYTNVNHSCPFTGHIFARNFFLDENLFPTFPLGFYLMIISVFENYVDRPPKLAGAIKYYFQVKEMEAKKRRKPLPRYN